MEQGTIFTIERWRDGEIKTYRCTRFCLKHITVELVEDKKQKWSMPYDRLKDINPKPKRLIDDKFKTSHQNL